jgi:hypothetical protein
MKIKRTKDFIECVKKKIEHAKQLNGVDIKILVTTRVFNELSAYKNHHSWAFETPIKPELKIGGCPVRPVMEGLNFSGVLLFRHEIENKSKFINITPQ